MSLQKNMRFAIGVDVGGSHVCSAVVSLATGEIAGCVSETPLDSGADAAAILDILSSNILQSLEPVEDGTVEGVGLAFPGPFDYPNGISKVNGVGKYERIYGLDLKTSLSSRLRSHGMDSFRFLNDASAFALGECAGGAGRGADRVVAITLGTGVGSGFVCGNRLVESGDEVPENGWVYHLPFEDGIADKAFSTRWICRRYGELSGMEIAGAKEVAARCAAGDRNAADLFFVLIQVQCLIHKAEKTGGCHQIIFQYNDFSVAVYDFRDACNDGIRQTFVDGTFMDFHFPESLYQVNVFPDSLDFSGIAFILGTVGKDNQIALIRKFIGTQSHYSLNQIFDPVVTE